MIQLRRVTNSNINICNTCVYVAFVYNVCIYIDIIIEQSYGHFDIKIRFIKKIYYFMYSWPEVEIYAE